MTAFPKTREALERLWPDELGADALDELDAADKAIQAAKVVAETRGTIPALDLYDLRVALNVERRT